MEYKVCVRCHREKTVRQFSLRKIDTCRMCMMALNRSGDLPFNAHAPVITPDTQPPPSIRRLIKPQPIEVTEVPKPKPKPKPQVAKRSGFRVIDTPIRPTVRLGSVTYGNMCEEAQRSISKAEYRARKTKEYREKKLK